MNLHFRSDWEFTVPAVFLTSSIGQPPQQSCGELCCRLCCRAVSLPSTSLSIRARSSENQNQSQNQNQILSESIFWSGQTEVPKYGHFDKRILKSQSKDKKYRSTDKRIWNYQDFGTTCFGVVSMQSPKTDRR